MADAHGLALVPRRRGQLLLTAQTNRLGLRKSIIPLWGHKFIILGRLELLSCVYAACGCSNKLRSTQGKCGDCNSQAQWAARALSRQMIKIDKNILQVRGSYSVVMCNSEPVGDDTGILAAAKHATDNDWRGHAHIQSGARLSFRELYGDGVLDFQLVLVHKKTSTIVNTSPHTGGDKSTENNRAVDIFLQRHRDRSSRSTVLSQQSLVPIIPVQFILYFVPLGQDLPRQRIVLLSQKAKERGAVVTTEFLLATHLVVSDQVATLRQVADRLSCKSEDSLRQHLDEKNVACVLSSWISSSCASTVLQPPSLKELWLGYWPKKRRLESDSSRPNRKRLRAHSTSTHNDQLADLFQKLSKLYQSAPLWPEDIWKAYSFHKIAGRIKCLDFSVGNQILPMSKRLKDIPGINNSTMAMISEYQQTGSISRMHSLNHDPTRIAMRNMMAIWGVGRVTALQLVQRGYHNIEQVRSAVMDGTLRLSRNQLVGVECYEDIGEELPRAEVETIGNLVISTFQSLEYADAQGNIMGSYRRGKAFSGDVDVLITIKEFRNTVPAGALSELVDTLWAKGHIAYHLTFLPGMESGVVCADEEPNKLQSSGDHRVRFVTKTSLQGRVASSSSYMGVFYSPCIPGKRRRVDIKIYPYAHRAFASLYFTGSAHFNRSMRLWAKQKFNLKLTDHGIFDITTGNRVIIQADTERHVFDSLKLHYKVPVERTYFDDVVPAGHGRFEKVP